MVEICRNKKVQQMGFQYIARKPNAHQTDVLYTCCRDNVDICCIFKKISDIDLDFVTPLLCHQVLHLPLVLIC